MSPARCSFQRVRGPWPALLAASTWLHLGKGTVMGLGQLRITAAQAESEERLHLAGIAIAARHGKLGTAGRPVLCGKPVAAGSEGWPGK